MAYTPLMEPYYAQQGYKEVIYGLNLLGTYTIPTLQLADATDSTVYAPGLVLAQYTAGADVGKLVNWKEDATNGQGTAVGVLTDQNLAPTATPSNYSDFVLAEFLQIGGVYEDALVVTTGSDIDVALGQLNAVLIATPEATRRAYNIRGSLSV